LVVERLNYSEDMMLVVNLVVGYHTSFVERLNYSEDMMLAVNLVVGYHVSFVDCLNYSEKNRKYWKRYLVYLYLWM
jgi:uncharacterized membrane protein YwzB